MKAWTGVFVIVVALASPCSPYSTKIEAQLRAHLFSNYTAACRPTEVTDIFLSIQLTSIKSVDIKNQQFSLSGWWSMRWTDPRLTWSPRSYDNISILQIKQDFLWTPTLVVDNSIDDLSAIDEDTIPLRVEKGGLAIWNPPALLTVACEMDITLFPFDKQTCSIQVTSFGYTMEELNIRVQGQGVVLTYFQEDGEWDLESIGHSRTILIEDNYTYSRVSYIFSMKRKPLYYGLNMLLPVMINSCLTIFVFLVPADSGEKIGYCLTSLLAFTVILTLIAADLPTTAKFTSMLELYIAVALIMGGLSVVFSIFVLEVYSRTNDQPIPRYVRRLTFIGMHFSCYRERCKTFVQPSEGPNTFQDKDTRPAVRHLTNTEGETMNRRLPKKQNELALGLATGMSTLEEQVHGCQITWQTVSIVMDRVLFRFYILFFLAFTVVFLSILIR